jgi:peptidyl-dipeptidase Dcp
MAPLKIYINLLLSATISTSVAFAGNSNSGNSNDNNLISETVSEEQNEQNPLLIKWDGPYGGVPPFDKVKVDQFKPALEAAMAENLAEIEKISSNPEAPTFENTIVAMERSGKTLDRVQTIYGVWSSTMSSQDFQSVEGEMEPKLAEFSDKITQNEKLFKRIEAVYNSPAKKNLTPEQQRLTWLYYSNFVRAGAKLEPAAKTRVGEINQKLAGLFTKFSQNLLGDEMEKYVVLKSEIELAGLPQSLKDAAAANAVKKNLQGSWVITNTRSSVDPFLTYSARRDLREQVWRMFVNRGDNGDKNDNNAIITEILQLRAERATILGYKTHAHWRLENSMAKTPERAIELMEEVWNPAIERVKIEVADMQAYAGSDGEAFKIEPWDYRYYAEKVRKQRYDLDQNEVKQYLQLEKLREGMFWVAGELFGFEFTPVANVPVYNPDIRVWEVTDKKTKKHIGLWYFDAYAREGKRSGAWMNAYRSQQRVDKEITTIVSNNSNFIIGKPGEPVLISWDDANTLFHEFGHALHGLASKVTYPSVSGTNVFRDYVEFPSQLLENWLSTPEVLQKFAVHFETGKPIPQSLVDKLDRASTFNEGFATTEYLGSAIVDMKLHLAGSEKIDPDAFEKKTLDALNMPSEIVMRHRTPQFGHIFSSDGYSAGYYSYLWADVITSDCYSAFTEAGGPYDKAVAEKLNKYIFSVGNTIDPADGYRSFRGRDAKVEALMVKRGFPVSSGGKKGKQPAR